jgi:hypothetical protein
MLLELPISQIERTQVNSLALVFGKFMVSHGIGLIHRNVLLLRGLNLLSSDFDNFPLHMLSNCDYELRPVKYNFKACVDLWHETSRLLVGSMVG